MKTPLIKDGMLEFMRGKKIFTTHITLPPLKFDPIKK